MSPVPRPGAGLPAISVPRGGRWQPPSSLSPEERRDRRTYVSHYLHALDERYRDLDDGEPAAYIPALARADRGAFGIAVMANDGSEHHVGDAHDLFSIQSISKVLLYALALETLGRDEVHERVGVEPSGEQFNSIDIDEASNRPFNPMVNAGAITIADLVPGKDLDERLQLVLDAYRRFLGREVEVDETVFRSELATAHRNRAIAYLLLSRGVLQERVEETIELYTLQCSVLVTAHDLAVAAATLGNAGVNPVTKERAVPQDNVRDVLSVMLTCGMYDYSGEWVYRVGLPAKSGVGGGVMAVLPGIGGLGVWSPPLDRFGNSVRAVRVCEDMAHDLRVHLFEPGLPWEPHPEEHEGESGPAGVGPGQAAE
jgi:glutaminase